MNTGKVKYVVYPFYLGRPEVALATEAAWCAADQDHFFAYQHALYENFEMTLSEQNLVELASELELDMSQFEPCLSNRTHRNDVEAARQAAMRQGVNSTPTFFVNGQKLEGNQPYSAFQTVIDRYIQQAQNTP